MEQYTVRVTIEAIVEAPDVEDVKDMVHDHFGPGSGGEGVTITSCEYEYR